jgi:hypothetical protein
VDATPEHFVNADSVPDVEITGVGHAPVPDHETPVMLLPIVIPLPSLMVYIFAE